MQTFARKLNLIALALGAALTAPGCATDWFSSSSSDYVAGELSQDVENLPDPNAPPAPPKRPAIVSPLGASFKESPDRLLLQANAYFEQGKFHDSARLYQKYLATPEAATAPPTVLGQAHHRIAVVARKKMSFAEAKREFETALRYEPQNQQYRFDLGKSAFDGADYATADAAFSALIAQNPNYPQAQYYYGLTLLEGTRRAEALAPLTKAVGELEAAALLADKYYALGETENAATWEAQTTQIAARLGRPVPAFPNKPAFASTVQPQAQLAQTQQPQAQLAQVAQPQAPLAQTQQPQAPLAQTQQPQAQLAQVAQPQAPLAQTQQPQAPLAQTQQPQAPLAQTQQPQAQLAQVAQPQAPLAQTQQPQAQLAQVAQPQAPLAQTQQPQAPVAQVAQPQAPLTQVAQPQAPLAQTQQPQAPLAQVAQPQAPLAQVEQTQAPLAQLQGPEPFLAAPAEPQAFVVATPETNVAQEASAETSSSTAEEITALAPALAEEETQNAQNLTACIGRRNPGLFATSSAAPSAGETGFRPGSISTTDPSPAQLPQETQTTQNTLLAQLTQETQTTQNTPLAQSTQETQTTLNDPLAQLTQETQTTQNVPLVGPQLTPAPRFDAETAFRRFELLIELENCVAERFAPLAPIYETAPSPFQVAEAQELYAAAPSPIDLADANAEDEEFDENDDFAFASSGSSQAPQSTTPAAAIGGFGSYQAPTFDATPLATLPTQTPLVPQNAYAAPFPQVAQGAPTTQTAPVPQNAYAAPFPQVAQSAPTTQTAPVPQNAYVAPFPQVAQGAPTTQTAPVPQNAYAAPFPQVAQSAPTTQTPLVPQNAYVAPFPQVAQGAPATPVSQYAAPAASRRPSTPEERLQAAIAAGAEVREISPEEYRRAVQVGMSGQAQPR